MDNTQFLNILKYAMTQEVLDYDPDEAVTLHSDLFADTVNRQYPIHKRAAIHTSIIEFIEKGDARKYVLDRLIKAAHIHNMPTIEKLAEVKTVNFKITTDSGHQLCSAYVNSPASLLKVASSVITCKYPYHIRKKAAMGLINIADALNIDVDPSIYPKLEKAAGLGVSTLEHVKGVVAKRAASISAWSMREASDMLWSAANNIKDHDGYVTDVDMHKIASILDVSDKYFKKNYDNVEQELYQHTMSDLYKVACDMLPLSNGAILSKSEVINNKTKVEQLFKAAGINTSTDEEILSTIAGADTHLACAIEKLF